MLNHSYCRRVVQTTHYRAERGSRVEKCSVGVLGAVLATAVGQLRESLPSSGRVSSL